MQYSGESPQAPFVSTNVEGTQNVGEGQTTIGDLQPMKGIVLKDMRLVAGTIEQDSGHPSTAIAERLTPIRPLPEETPAVPSSADDLLQSSEDIEQPSTSTHNLDKIVVKDFKVIGSTVFSDAELAAVTAEFTQRLITFSELMQARSAITQLYIDNGYKTTGAFIPPGPITDGIVTIQVVEGALAEIQVTGNERLSTEYVRDRIALAAQPPLNVDRLLEALQLLQLNPRIETLSAELSAGTRPGTSLLQVTLTEAKTFRPRIILDNERFSSVGSFQRQIELRELNMMGNGDIISLNYANTDGLNEIDFGYIYPINPRNGTLGVRVNQLWSEVIQEPFDVLDLTGDSFLVEMTFRQPVIETPRQELALGITMGRRESTTFLLGMLFPVSPGADLSGRTEFTPLRLFQEWTQRGRSTVLALRSEFSIGLPLGATNNPTPPDGEFFLWRGQAQWVKQVAVDTLVLLRSNMQFADRPIVPLEQFGVGGLNSVRGYRQNFFLVDNGLFISAEGRVPILRIFNGDGLMQIAPFIDFGTGWNNGPGRLFTGENSVLSAGLGLRWQWTDRLSARVDFGFPLISVGDEASALDDPQVFFSIVATPY